MGNPEGSMLIKELLKEMSEHEHLNRETVWVLPCSFKEESQSCNVKVNLQTTNLGWTPVSSHPFLSSFLFLSWGLITLLLKLSQSRQKQSGAFSSFMLYQSVGMPVQKVGDASFLCLKGSNPQLLQLGGWMLGHCGAPHSLFFVDHDWDAFGGKVSGQS